MNSTMPLYTSLAPDNKYEIVFEQQLASQGITIALRPLCLPEDWPYIGKWLHRAFGRRFSSIAHLPDKHLRETFSIMLQCDFAQPFIGLINDNPAFLIEIADGDKQCDEQAAGAHIFTSGDHSIRLILSRTVIHTRYWSEYALLGSLGYFFSHRQVQRIVWQLHEKDTFYINLANQSGFTACTASNGDRCLDSAQDPEVEVYLYLRENFTHFFTTRHQQTKKLS
jgi:hypothetical protein